MCLDENRIVPAGSRRPRGGWDAAFERMALAGDDALLLPEDVASDWDDEDWEW